MYGFIDHAGKFAIPPTLLDADDFSDGMVRVVLDGPCFFPGSGECDLGEIVPPNSGKKSELPPTCKVTFIDKTGRVISAVRFDGAKAFSEGLAPVKAGSLWGYIDKDGAMAIAFAPANRDTVTSITAGSKRFADRSCKQRTSSMDWRTFN